MRLEGGRTSGWWQLQAPGRPEAILVGPAEKALIFDSFCGDM